MTSLIQNHSVLKNSGLVRGSDVIRLVLSETGYSVHLEHTGFTSGEMFLYQGNDLDAATWVYNRYLGVQS